MTSKAPFDGVRFRNPSGRAAHGLADVFKMLRGRDRGAWPDTVPGLNSPPPPERVADGSIRATMIGHATVLVQVAGLNLITDPVWSKRIGPTSWLGPARYRPPAFAFEALPPIDAVLLSHNHYDHLDRPTLKRLAKRDNPLIVTGLRVGQAVPSRNVVECDWWDSTDLPGGVRVTYVPAEHFSSRGPFDRDKTLWGGFVVEAGDRRIFFAGDSGRGEHFAAIEARFGPMTLSLMPIGAYAPRWFMSPIHMNPQEAVEASIALRSRLTIPIHYDTFRLADEAFDAPLAELQAALDAVAPGTAGTDFRPLLDGAPLIIPA